MGSVASSSSRRQPGGGVESASSADGGDQSPHPTMEKPPSGTAAWVAAHRALGELLPAHLRLVEDPFGRVLGGGRLEWGRWVEQRWPSLWKRLIQLPYPLNMGVSTFLVRHASRQVLPAQKEGCGEGGETRPLHATGLLLDSGRPKQRQRLSRLPAAVVSWPP